MNVVYSVMLLVFVKKNGVQVGTKYIYIYIRIYIFAVFIIIINDLLNLLCVCVCVCMCVCVMSKFLVTFINIPCFFCCFQMNGLRYFQPESPT